MISLLSENYHTPVQREDQSRAIDTAAFRKHLMIVSWIENFLKIRDYFLIAREPTGAPKYIIDEESRNLRFCRQFNGVNNNLEFYKRVHEKLTRDDALDYSEFAINSMFDEGMMEGPIKANGSKTVTYLHFSLKEEFTGDNIKVAIQEIINKQSKSLTNLIFFIVAPLIGVAIDVGNSYTKFNAELSKQFKITVTVMTIDRLNSKFDQFSKCYFDLSTKENNVYLINKILTARRTMAEMVQGRGYTGISSYVYYDDLSGRFAHFLMNLEKRLDLAQRDNLPLAQSNYFDMYGLYKVTSSKSGMPTPVYIHFILQPYSELAEYIKKIEARIRDFLGVEQTDPIHLILVVNKKQTAKNMIEKIGDRPNKNDSLTVDVHLLDNLLYNPLRNVNQPKFKLLKRSSPEYMEAIKHYGSSDDIPKMKPTDPVNRFFGGEYNDIYRIFRPTLVKINDETRIHLDVAYRIVKT